MKKVACPKVQTLHVPSLTGDQVQAVPLQEEEPQTQQQQWPRSRAEPGQRAVPRQ